MAVLWGSTTIIRVREPDVDLGGLPDSAKTVATYNSPTYNGAHNLTIEDLSVDGALLHVDHEVRLRADQLPQRFAHKRVIVDDKNPSRCALDLPCHVFASGPGR